uniref:Serine aminopeptidase S33 domain-containing protein n=1 Tax=Anopheles culicifacies TaxID=139723 RepID=A0A182MFN5_9DIPT
MLGQVNLSRERSEQLTFTSVSAERAVAPQRMNFASKSPVSLLNQRALKCTSRWSVPSMKRTNSHANSFSRSFNGTESLRKLSNTSLPTIDGSTSNGGSISHDTTDSVDGADGTDRYSRIEKILRQDHFKPTDEANQRELFEEALRATTNDVVLYLHGNTASRGAPHRVELYQTLRALNYHVIAMDYRGYGDSANVSPTERGVVYDALAVYQYITSITKNPVYLWGHSLGTGVSTHLMSLLTEMSLPGPRALVLESPFNNIKEEICAHPFSKLYRHLPWFDILISRPMYNNMLRFESDQHIAEFRQPVLILHAEDDLVVPFELGYKLYRRALDTRGKAWGPIEFHRFEKSSHYGHKYICRAPNLPEIVVRFFHAYRNEQY